MPRRSPAGGGIDAVLARGRLGISGVLFFILAGVAPLTVTAGVVPAAYAATGLTAVPAAFLVVAAVLAVFAVGYTAMARRIPHAGAFYAFIAHGLGRPAGVGAALIAVVAYNLLQVGLYGMIGPSLSAFAADNLHLAAPWWVWAFGTWAVVTVLGLVRVDLSGRLLGFLSMIELAIIAVLTVNGLSHPAGGHISAAPLSPTSMHLSGLGALLAVAVLGFTGFEQGPVFSEEARDPRRTIPAATYISLGVVAVVYAAAAWALDVHYGTQVVAIAQSPASPTMLFAMAPGVLASAARTLFLTSLLAAAIAFHTAVGRYMWTLGRERVLPAAMGRSGKTGVPATASLVQSLLGVTAIAVTVVAHWDPVGQLFFWGGTTGGFGILLLLVSTSAAVVRYMLIQPGGESLWQRLIAPATAMTLLTVMVVLCVMHYAMLLNVPPGSAAARILPALFGIAAVFGIAWALILKRIHPQAYAAIGLGGAAAAKPAAGSGIPAASAESAAR
ncbi:APC family permease [Catenulispora yoronensis]|uniref:APC family permease n=1 Tax=Catenulispora yoronensis TaxID=450799 RepID=A0ABP5FKX4_9ACTN